MRLRFSIKDINVYKWVSVILIFITLIQLIKILRGLSGLESTIVVINMVVILLFYLIKKPMLNQVLLGLLVCLSEYIIISKMTSWNNIENYLFFACLLIAFRLQRFGVTFIINALLFYSYILEYAAYTSRVELVNGLITIFITIVTISFFGTSYSQLSGMYEEIVRISYTDEVTKIANRKKLIQTFQKWSKDYQNISLILVNIDRFKEVNHNYGSKVGDDILSEVAWKLKSLENEDVFLARYGGDEFILLVKGKKGRVEVEQLCKQIQTLMAISTVINGKYVVLTVSMGVVEYGKDSKELDELLSYGDGTVKVVKNRGGNEYLFFDASIKKRFERYKILNRDKEQALKEGQFFLLYQPKINSFTNELYGVEALIRWNHPHLGILSPIEFIPIFEESKFITQIGQWVISEGCKQLGKWHQAGFPICLSINVSPIQFESNQLIYQIESSLKENNIEGKYLTVELTEQIMFQDLKTVVSILKKIQTLGVRISLDDFGTGYSSLAYLQKIPLDEIKIAREFLINQDESGTIAFLNAIRALAKHLNLVMVAEGVETPKHVEILKNLEVDYLQGYYYSKPVTTAEIEDLYLRKGNAEQ